MFRVFSALLENIAIALISYHITIYCLPDNYLYWCALKQWDLVCDDNYLNELSQSVFYCGVLLGAIIFTWSADRFGRKLIHLGCQFTVVIFGVAVAFAPNYITYVVLRFFLGAVREVNA